MQNVLFTMGQLSGEFPEVVENLASRLKDADLRIPARPPNRAGLTAGGNRSSSRGGLNGGNSISSRPGTAGSDAASVRSVKSSTSNNNMKGPPMKAFVPDF